MSGSARRSSHDFSTDPRRGALRRRWMSALGLALVLFNVVAGTLLAGASSAEGSPLAAALSGDRIVVCAGHRLLILDDKGRPVSPADAADAVCAFCLPLLSGSADAPVVALAPVVTDVVFVIAWGTPALTAPVTAHGNPAAPPRGPPLA